MFKPEYLILADGVKLAYTVHGREHLVKKQTLPLVLIAGAGSTQVDWSRLLPRLSTKRTVLTFDHREIGLSTCSTPKAHDKFSIELLARDVVTLVERLGWTDIDVLGYSMGGVLLQQILLSHRHPTSPYKLPFRIHHALLAATYASPVPMKDYGKRLSTTDLVGNDGGHKSSSENQIKSYLNEILELSFSPKWMAAPENKAQLKVWRDNSAINRPFDIILKQRRILSKFSFVDELKYIDPSIKILVIHGMDDHCAPFSSAEEILRACPHAQLVTIGSKWGQVPSYDFGHLWYEYFDVEVWFGVLESFLDERASAKL